MPFRPGRDGGFGKRKLTSHFDLQKFVLAAPERQSRQPVFAIDQLLGRGPLLPREDVRRRGKIGSRYFAANSARRNLYLRIISYAPVLP